MPSAIRFDQDYYDRFYRNPRTRAGSPAGTARLGRFVCSYLKHLGLPIQTVLDLGCGLGWWRPVIAREFPGASYHGVEASSHLCATLGWEKGSVVDFRSRHPFDLVVCQGVLPYLPAPLARRAIANLARLTAGALYLEAITQADWDEACDRKRTDGRVYLRSGSWYRQALAGHFQAAGGGLFLAPRAGTALYELEGLAL